MSHQETESQLTFLSLVSLYTSNEVLRVDATLQRKLSILEISL